MPKIKEKAIENTITADGELIERHENYLIQYESEPNYIKLYLDTVLYLSDLPKGYNSILLGILRYMTYSSPNNAHGGQVIYFNSTMKQDIAKELNVSVQRVNQAISDFTKGKILERINTGTYRVNPYLFGKGDWQDISEIRMKVVFNAEGKTVMSEIDKHNEKNDKVKK